MLQLRTHLVQPTEPHGAPVDAGAQLTDVEDIAVSGRRHFVHQVGAENILGLPDLPGVLVQQLKSGIGINKIRALTTPHQQL